MKLHQSAASGSGTFIVSPDGSRAQMKELLALRLPEMPTKLGESETYSLHASYLKQAKLNEQSLGTVDRAAELFHQKGYYGLSGIDIVTDASGNNYIIQDVNVPNTGSKFV